VHEQIQCVAVRSREHALQLFVGGRRSSLVTEVYKLLHKQHGNKAKKGSEKQSLQGNPFF
jgi:hypothetical protein